MITYALYAAYGLLSLAIGLSLLRLVRGPTVIDRIIAFDLIATAAVGMVVLLSIQWQTALYLELILIFSLLGFFGTVAFVYYLSRTEDLERPEEPTGGTDHSSPPSHHG